MSNRFDDAVSGQTSLETGVVIKHEQREYTQTTVSGGGGHVDHYGNRVGGSPVTSHTTHHHKQDIWYRDSDGQEHNLALHNVNFKIIDGQGVAILRSKATGQALRVANLETRYFWDIALGLRKLGKLGEILGPIGIRLKALILAALAAVPWINVVTAIVLLATLFSRRHFRRTYIRARLYGALYIVAASVAFMPVSDEVIGTHFMDAAISEGDRFKLNGSIVRSLAITVWAVGKPFEQVIGEKLANWEDFSSALEGLPDTVYFVYRAEGSKQPYSISHEYILYEQGTRDVFWLGLFTLFAFLFMYMRSVSTDRINRGLSEALDRRIKEIIAKAGTD